MKNPPKEINLEGKMDDWGPYGKNEYQWLIFSVGNPEEGHGYALPRAMDDLSAKHLAHLIEIRTGQRYVAHIPYTTDHQGEVAKNWMPRYLPFEQFVQKTIEFLRFHINIIKEQKMPASKIMIVSTHGGNDDIGQKAEYIQQQLGIEKVWLITGAAAAQQVDRVLKNVEELAKQYAQPGEDPDDLAFKYVQILTTVGHADHFEHSIAAAMGILDWEKLKVMNTLLEKDFEAALKKWPPIGGLGGFITLGGKYTDAAGTKEKDKYGLWNCLRGLKELDHGKMVVRKELGEMLLKVGVELIAEELDRMDAAGQPSK